MDLLWIFSLLMATIRAAALNTSSTQSDYHFLTHMFSNLSCDPYANKTSSSLALECSVQGPRITPTRSFKIVWYRTLENMSAIQNMNNLYANQSELVEIEEQKIAFFNFSEIIIVRSVLTVANLNTNNVSGKYWCTVEEEDQMNVLTSENALVPPLTLHRSSVYQGLDECPEGVIHTAMASNPISPSTSSPSYISTNSTPLTTTSSFSTSTFSIENISNKIIEQSVIHSHKLGMTWIIVFSVTIGVLVFAVHVLLVALGCLCCGGVWRRSKEKQEILPFHHPAVSPVSSSSFFGSDRISPITSPTPLLTPLTPITHSEPSSPPGIILTKPPNYPPPQMKPPLPKSNPPPPKMKPPPLPLWSTLPSQLMYQMLIPSSPDTNHLQDKSTYRKRAATVASEMSYCYAYQAEQKMIHFSDIARMHVTEKNQDQLLISPLSRRVTDDIYAPICTLHGRSIFDRNSTTSTASGSSDETDIIKQGTNYTPPCMDLASLSFTNKYKSLIIETMDGCPVYQYPIHATSTGERDEDADSETENNRINRNKQVKIAMEYARLHLMDDEMSEDGGMFRDSVMSESMDGDYVLPNLVIQTLMTSPNNEELTTVEQPDYISLS